MSQFKHGDSVKVIGNRRGEVNLPPATELYLGSHEWVKFDDGTQGWVMADRLTPYTEERYSGKEK
jgi:hypothetical protein